MDLSNKNVIHVKQENSEYLQFRKLLEYKDIVTHAYTLGKNVNFRTAKANKDPLEKEIYKQNTQNYKDVEQMYRRMVFNYIAENKDDHCKNFSFIVTKDKDNKWTDYRRIFRKNYEG